MTTCKRKKIKIVTFILTIIVLIIVFLFNVLLNFSPEFQSIVYGDIYKMKYDFDYSPYRNDKNVSLHYVICNPSKNTEQLIEDIKNFIDRDKTMSKVISDRESSNDEFVVRIFFLQPDSPFGSWSSNFTIGYKPRDEYKLEDLETGSNRVAILYMLYRENEINEKYIMTYLNGNIEKTNLN